MAQGSPLRAGLPALMSGLGFSPGGGHSSQSRAAPRQKRLLEHQLWVLDPRARVPFPLALCQSRSLENTEAEGCWAGKGGRQASSEPPTGAPQMDDPSQALLRSPPCTLSRRQAGSPWGSEERLCSPLRLRVGTPERGVLGKPLELSEPQLRPLYNGAVHPVLTVCRPHLTGMNQVGSLHTVGAH